MALQEKGDTAEEIAQAIGLKNAAAWYSTRAYHGGRKLAQRAIPKTENTPEPAAILEGINCERTAPRAMPMLNAECGMRNAETGAVSQAASNGLKAVEGLFGRLKGSKPADVDLQDHTVMPEQVGPVLKDGEIGWLNSVEARKIGEDIAEGIMEGASSPDAADAMAAFAKAAREVLRLGAVTPDQIRSSLLPESTDDERYWPADMLPFNPSLPVTAPRRVAVLKMVCAEGERVRYRLQDGQVNIHAKGQKRCALALSIEEARCMILELTDFLAQTEAMA